MKVARATLILLVLASSVALGACGRASKRPPAPAHGEVGGDVAFQGPADKSRAMGNAASTAAEPPPPPAPSEQISVEAAGGPSAAFAAQAAARKLIRTGQVSLEVPKYDAAASEVARIVEAKGGYVSGSQTTRAAANRQHGSLTVRIPADRFAETVSALKALGKVLSESMTTEDVTKAYADLETRLRVKRETEARLRDILKNRAAKLGDILEAERELSRVIEEIEQAEGERRFYDQQVALSTLVVQLQEPEAVIRPSALEPFFEALREAIPVLAESVAAIVYVVMAGLPWVALLYGLLRLVRWARRRRAARESRPVEGSPKP